MKLNSSATIKTNFVDELSNYEKNRLYKEVQAYYTWIREENEYLQTIKKR